MKYQQDREDALELAKEKVSEAAGILEEVMPEAAEELSWIWENIRGELLSVRSTECALADGVFEEVCGF